MEKKNCLAVNENPCHMCMPMGGILAFKGIEQAMVLLHGSQGCATYMRRHIAEHFNEPIDVGSSSLNEKGTIYGGANNLKQGLDNLIKVYNPQLIGVLTTCLAETIGEDVERITTEYRRERAVKKLPIISVATPGYGGSHSEGYWLTVKQLVAGLAQETILHSKFNIIIPHLSPADIREIKRILELMQIDYTLLPDFSETLDRPFSQPYQKVPVGGTKLEDIRKMPGAVATIQFGLTAEEHLSPGQYLEKEFGVPFYNLPIPIGIAQTDLFIETLENISGRTRPESLVLERGRLLDSMIDSHKYNFQGRSVIFGEPELVYAQVQTCLENGIYPVVIATGSKSNKLAQLLKPALEQSPIEARFFNAADFSQIREASKAEQANIAIGHSDGRYLTEKEGIPLIRTGFPIHDRVGGQRILSVGYTGTSLFLDRITNTLLEHKLENYRENIYQQFYQDDTKKII